MNKIKKFFKNSSISVDLAALMMPISVIIGMLIGQSRLGDWFLAHKLIGSMLVTVLAVLPLGIFIFWENYVVRRNGEAKLKETLNE